MSCKSAIKCRLYKSIIGAITLSFNIAGNEWGFALVGV